MCIYHVLHVPPFDVCSICPVPCLRRSDIVPRSSWIDSIRFMKIWRSAFLSVAYSSAPDILHSSLLTSRSMCLVRMNISLTTLLMPSVSVLSSFMPCRFSPYSFYVPSSSPGLIRVAITMSPLSSSTSISSGPIPMDVPAISHVLLIPPPHYYHLCR